MPFLHIPSLIVGAPWQFQDNKHLEQAMLFCDFHAAMVPNHNILHGL